MKSHNTNKNDRLGFPSAVLAIKSYIPQLKEGIPACRIIEMYK